MRRWAKLLPTGAIIGHQNLTKDNTDYYGPKNPNERFMSCSCGNSAFMVSYLDNRNYGITARAICSQCQTEFILVDD